MRMSSTGKVMRRRYAAASVSAFPNWILDELGGVSAVDI